MEDTFLQTVAEWKQTTELLSKQIITVITVGIKSYLTLISMRKMFHLRELLGFLFVF